MFIKAVWAGEHDVGRWLKKKLQLQCELNSNTTLFPSKALFCAHVQTLPGEKVLSLTPTPILLQPHGKKYQANPVKCLLC